MDAMPRFAGAECGGGAGCSPMNVAAAGPSLGFAAHSHGLAAHSSELSAANLYEDGS